MTPELASALAKLPDKPGVYLMKDARGEVIYVGKAQSLRHRVRSYWQKGTMAPLEGHRIRSVVDRIADVEVTQTDSVSEALLLEGKLIKQWRPRYNTDFTDDKRFLLVRVDLGEELPRFRLTRFKKEGMLNTKTAAEYRAAILAPGAGDDEAKLVARFLKRPPNDAAYKAFLLE